MREILFKAKRIDNGEWVEGYYVKNKGIHTKFPSVIFTNIDTMLPECFDFYEVDENTLCQYTGLTDKNGRKIWENDVVSMKYVDFVCNGVIEYKTENARFVFREFDDVYGADYGFDHTCEMEVIGNIFDNSELLEGGAE